MSDRAPSYSKKRLIGNNLAVHKPKGCSRRSFWSTDTFGGYIPRVAINTRVFGTMVLRFLKRRSSSSTVYSGSIYLRAWPPGACTTHPRTVRVPDSSGLPEITTWWMVLTGITTWRGFDSNWIPDVLIDEYQINEAVYICEFCYLNESSCNSKSKI